MRRAALHYLPDERVKVTWNSHGIKRQLTFATEHQARQFYCGLTSTYPIRSPDSAQRATPCRPTGSRAAHHRSTHPVRRLGAALNLDQTSDRTDRRRPS